MPFLTKSAVLFSLLLALPVDAQVIAEWSWLAGQEIQEDGTEVERSPAGCTQWQLVAINPANVMSMQVPDAPGDCYRVRAFIGAEYFPYSNIGTVPPAEPTPTPPPPCRQRGKSGKCK